MGKGLETRVQETFKFKAQYTKLLKSAWSDCNSMSDITEGHSQKSRNEKSSHRRLAMQVEMVPEPKPFLYYNAADSSQIHIDSTIKDFCKSNKCTRLFLSAYFNVKFQQTTILECCCQFSAVCRTHYYLIPIPGAEKASDVCSSRLCDG